MQFTKRWNRHYTKISQRKALWEAKSNSDALTSVKSMAKNLYAACKKGNTKFYSPQQVRDEYIEAVAKRIQRKDSIHCSPASRFQTSWHHYRARGPCRHT
ncbi:hypothetical protein V5799_024822 [Amblyomma americanum]|uniref:Uncharacterized protein n=1 Tax=Amblyomma americanum TaxID=6943 RepID=A0AAQ4EB86_AMBAM